MEKPQRILGGSWTDEKGIGALDAATNEGIVKTKWVGTAFIEELRRTEPKEN